MRKFEITKILGMENCKVSEFGLPVFYPFETPQKLRSKNLFLRHLLIVYRAPEVCVGKLGVWMKRSSQLRRARNGVAVFLTAYLGARRECDKVFSSLEVVRSGSKTKWNKFVSHIFEGLCLLLTDSFNLLCPP